MFAEDKLPTSFTSSSSCIGFTLIYSVVVAVPYGNLTSTVCSIQMLYFQWDDVLSISIKVSLGIDVGTVAGMLIELPANVNVRALRRQGLRLTDIMLLDLVSLNESERDSLLEVLVDVPLDVEEEVLVD